MLYFKDGAREGETANQCYHCSSSFGFVHLWSGGEEASLILLGGWQKSIGIGTSN